MGCSINRTANGGTLINPLTLGPGSLTGEVGFDIFGANTAFLSTTGTGPTNFYSINLGTGAATLIGAIGGGVVVTDIAVSPIPEPGTVALLGLGLAVLFARHRRRN